MRIISSSFLTTLLGLLLKGVVGLVCGSRALLADAVHSLTDTVAFGVNYAGATMTERVPAMTPFRQGVAIGTAIFLSGVWVCADNIATLVGGPLVHPGLLGLVVAVASTAVNGQLYRSSACASARLDDPHLRVCLVQNRTNFMASCISLAGVGLAELGLEFFDPLCAVVIGVLLVGSALVIFAETFHARPRPSLAVRRNVVVAVGALSCGILAFYARDVVATVSEPEVVLVPSRGTAIGSPVDALLGRAEYFVVYDTKRNAFAAIPNSARLLPTDVSQSLTSIVRSQKVDVVVAPKIGDEMYADLRAEGVRMYYCPSGLSVQQALAALGRGQLDLARGANVHRRYGMERLRWLAPW